MSETQFTTSALHWQAALGREGEIVRDLDDIAQCLYVIAVTPKGAVPLQPDFGCDAWRYLDFPVLIQVPHLVRELTDAWRRWEPRIILKKISPVINGAHVSLRVAFDLTTGTRESLLVSLRGAA